MGKKVMVVDDEPDILKVIQTRLEASGYETILASNGEEALKVIGNTKPDLILLDILMPKMDGYTFLREVKKRRVNVPIIVLTAKSAMKDLFEIEGVKDYIVKPFDSAELIKKISAYIG